MVWMLAVSFLSVEAVIPLIESVPVYGQHLLPGPIAIVWWPASWQWRGPVGRWGHRLLLVAGPWAVAVILREVEDVPRAFGSTNGGVCAFWGVKAMGGAWLQCPGNP